MDAKEFISELELDIYSNKDSFVSNMKHMNLVDKSYCEWIEVFSAWMEWATKEDCNSMYGRRE